MQAIQAWWSNKGSEISLIDEVHFDQQSGTGNIRIRLSLNLAEKCQLQIPGDDDFLRSLNDDWIVRCTINGAESQLEQLFSRHVYRDRYEILANYYFIDNKRVYLPTSSPSNCRFCSRSSPDVTFIHKAHAVPVCLGNKTLFSKNECDSCNAFFGDTIESHLGNVTLNSRVLGGVPNRKGLPSHHGDGWSSKIENGVIVIEEGSKDLNVRVSADQKKVNFTASTRSYIPVAIFKAFVKMAISLMPDNEVANFDSAREWLLERDYCVRPTNTSHFFDCYRSFFSGCTVPGHALLFRRTVEDRSMPYMTLVVEFGSFSYQIAVTVGSQFQNPMPVMHSHSAGYRSNAPIDIQIIDLSSAHVVTTEAETYTLEGHRIFSTG